MNDIIFSIIIPTYNRAHMLPKTIESVINQTFSDWELIIVDDGSTDNTKVLIEEFIEKDARIKYIYQENAERSAARNNGIENASGEYICFLDSDDWYLENHLSRIYEEINKLEVDTLESFIFVNAIQDTKHNQNPIISPVYSNNSDYFLSVPIIPARVCIHKNILAKHQFDPQIVIVEDSVLWTHIHLEYNVIHIPDKTIVYRWHEDNSVNIKNNCFLPRLKGLQRLFESKKIKKEISLSVRRRQLSSCYYGIAKYYAFKKKFFPMFFNVIYSIILHPNSPQSKAKLFMLYAFFRKHHISYL